MTEQLNNINISLSCDENYSKYAAVVIASILANADINDNLNFYILDGNISQKSKDKILSLKSIKNCSIEFVAINENDFEEYKNINNQNYISISTYYRLKLATLLPNVDKIIYLDCDIVVCESLQQLYNYELKDNIYAGVLDIDVSRKNNPKYVNAGVLLMDLAKVRQYNIEKQFAEYAKNNWEHIQLGDQDIINGVLRDRILNIPQKYNVQSECFINLSNYTKEPAIIHYIGRRKPWHFASWSIHKDLYFKYLQLTPWKVSKTEFLFYWKLLNKIVSFVTWIKHRPLFLLQTKFWRAVIKTYFNNGSGDKC